MITGITVPQDSGATQDDTGKVSLSAKIRDYTLNFPTTSLTRRLRLTVFQADLGTIAKNFVLTEVIASGAGDCSRKVTFTRSCPNSPEDISGDIVPLNVCPVTDAFHFDNEWLYDFNLMQGDYGMDSSFLTEDASPL